MHPFALVLLFAFVQLAVRQQMIQSISDHYPTFQNSALDCQKELDVVENCMGEQLERIIPNTTTTSPEKLKDEIKQCFVESVIHLSITNQNSALQRRMP